MKKIVALIMVLSMLLSCTAFAEKTSTQTVAQLYINPQLVAGEDEAVQTLVKTINSLTFTTTTGDNVVTMAYGANDTAIYDQTVAVTDEGLMYFSSIYPNTAILLNFAKLGQMIEQAIPAEVEEMIMQALESFPGIGNMFAPYLSIAAQQLTALESEVVVDETGKNAYLSITTQHLGNLLHGWVSHMQTDMDMLNVFNMIYDAATADAYNAPSFNDFFTQLYQETNNLKTAEPMEIATVGIYQGDDGSVCYELTVANQLLVSVDLYAYEELDCMDLLVIACDGTDNWQEVYEGICNGTNYSDVLFGLNVMASADYTNAQLYMTQSGTTMAVTMEETVENAFTDDQKTTTMISLDMASGDEEINLGGIAAETVLVDDYTMPSLDDKYVLDVFALPVDVLMNGLPQLVEGVVNGMPEMVNLVLESLSQVEGLEFLQAFTVPVPETPVAPAEPTEVTTVTNDDVITENAPATTTVTTDDEIAPHEETKTESAIEDM